MSQFVDTLSGILMVPEMPQIYLRASTFQKISWGGMPPDPPSYSRHTVPYHSLVSCSGPARYVSPRTRLRSVGALCCVLGARKNSVGRKEYEKTKWGTSSL